MGLFWRKETLSTGHRKLIGSRTPGGRAGAVDFWEQRGIYALYQDFDLVYVGQATDRGLGTRLTEHTRGGIAERWDRFSWFGFRLVNKSNKLRTLPARFHVNRDVVLNHIEGVLIEIAEPRLNGQGARWGSAVTLYHPAPTHEGSKSEGNQQRPRLADVRSHPHPKRLRG